MDDKIHNQVWYTVHQTCDWKTNPLTNHPNTYKTSMSNSIQLVIFYKICCISWGFETKDPYGTLTVARGNGAHQKPTNCIWQCIVRLTDSYTESLFHNLRILYSSLQISSFHIPPKCCVCVCVNLLNWNMSKYRLSPDFWSLFTPNQSLQTQVTQRFRIPPGLT